MPTPTPLPFPTPTQTAFLGIFAPGDPAVPVLINIVRALVILLIALVLARSARGWVVRLLTRGNRINLNIASLMGNLVQIAIVALGIINLLPAFGIDLASLITVLGVTGLAISLSLQDLLRNVVAGIYILMEQPFQIGDRITVKEVTGTVQSIELRTTLLRTDDGLLVVVPNNTVLTDIVTNRSASAQQKVTLKVRVPTTDIGQLQKMSDEIAALLLTLEGVEATPAPSVSMEGVFQGTARLLVEFWVPTGQKVGVSSRVVDALRAMLPAANIGGTG